MGNRTQYLAFGRPNFAEAEIAAVTRVMRSGWVGMGPETIEFERELAAFTGANQVVTVSSCTAALFLSLAALGIGPGDEVVCPSFTWCSTANAALYLGAKPVFCDIDAGTLSVTPETVLRHVTSRTRAVVVVHFGGLAVDVGELRKVLPESVSIVEDAAHALGACYPDGRPVGSSGNLCCFSFYANKNLSTGEGGAVALSDPVLSSKIQSLRQHGLPLDAWKRFTHPQSMLLSNQLTHLGYKMNYTDLQACIGREQLKRQGEFAIVRRAVAERYCSELGDLEPRLRFQTGCLTAAHALHLFVIQLPLESMILTREEVILGLRARNIGATLHYHPLHSMPLYGSANRLPVTEQVAKRCVTLPISASMSDGDTADVVEAFRDIYR